MLRSVARFVLAVSFAHAPYQCARSNDTQVRREETPAEALYALASKLREQGNSQGYRAALAFLVERYPSSRWAEAARLDLAQRQDGCRSGVAGDVTGHDDGGVGLGQGATPAPSGALSGCDR